MRPGTFEIAKSFLVENHPLIETFFKLMTVLSKQQIGEITIYKVHSDLFEGHSSKKFVICYKSGKFEAFPGKDEIPEGCLSLNQIGGTFKKFFLSTKYPKNVTMIGENGNSVKSDIVEFEKRGSK